MNQFLFKNIDWHGLMIFTGKENWLEVLSLLRRKSDGNPFFFFFDNERGCHLKIFFKNKNLEFVAELEKLLGSYVSIEDSKYPDPLFPNFKVNSIHRFQGIVETADISLPHTVSPSEIIEFCTKISNIIIGALGYNSFFLEEKHRINFAIQLAFLTSVRLSPEIKAKIFQACLNSEILKLENGLLEFYSEIQTIELEEGEIENWVKSWLNLSENFLNLETFDFTFDFICQVLEIRNFSEKLKNTFFAALKAEINHTVPLVTFSSN